MSAHTAVVSDLQRHKSEILKFKVMITEKLQNAINDQIIAEMWSANLYLSMSFYLEKEGYDGLSHWMKKQSQEELEHAYDMASFLQKRGGTAKVSMIDLPRTSSWVISASRSRKRLLHSPSTRKSRKPARPVS